MVCMKCGTELPDGAVCCWKCGKKLARAQFRKGHRPRGYGSIRRHSGKRNKPFEAILPASYGQGRVRRETLGYFETYAEADQALLEIRNLKNPAKKPLTLQELYDRFCATAYFQRLSASGRQSHETAWSKLKVDAKLPVIAWKTSQIQAVIDRMAKDGAAKSSVNKVRNLASLLCKEAMKDDLMDKNYARLTELVGADATESTPFSDLQIQLFWKHLADQTAQAILLMVYTGMRPG